MIWKIATTATTAMITAISMIERFSDRMARIPVGAAAVSVKVAGVKTPTPLFFPLDTGMTLAPTV